MLPFNNNLKKRFQNINYLKNMNIINNIYNIYAWKFI